MKINTTKTELKRKRVFGEFFTPLDIFKNFILPEIKAEMRKYIWVDLFAGEGNLILPILEIIPSCEREEFFKRHIFLFDVQETVVGKARQNAMEYGISYELAERNITLRDTIENYPDFLLH